jgi:hypothetical protein
MRVGGFLAASIPESRRIVRNQCLWQRPCLDGIIRGRQVRTRTNYNIDAFALEPKDRLAACLSCSQIVLTFEAGRAELSY